MGVQAHDALRVPDVDLGQQFKRPAVGARGGCLAVEPEHFHQLAADRHQGVQALLRVLHHHADAPAPDRPHAARAE